MPGGIGNHALHLALSLQKTGKEVTVITNQRAVAIQDDIAFDVQLPLKIERIKRRKIVLFTYLNRIFQVWHFVFRNKNLTIIASGKFSLWTSSIAKIFFSKNNYIAILHGSELNAGGTIGQKITGWSLKQFDSLIAVSSFTKKLALEKNAALNIVVINNGFALPKMELLDTNSVVKGNPAVVTVGNVTFRKGQQNVLNALPLLKERFPEIQYHIIGIPTEKPAFETLAKSLCVTENTTFHGALSNEDLKQVLSKCKVFFMLSDHLKNGDVEGFGIAVLEANYFGLPAIGSKNSGIADAVFDGHSGKLVDPHDPHEIVAAFQDIMDDYSHFSKEAKLWSAQFDWEIIIKKYLEIVDK